MNCSLSRLTKLNVARNHAAHALQRLDRTVAGPGWQFVLGHPHQTRSSDALHSRVGAFALVRRLWVHACPRLQWLRAVPAVAGRLIEHQEPKRHRLIAVAGAIDGHGPRRRPGARRHRRLRCIHRIGGGGLKSPRAGQDGDHERERKVATDDEKSDGKWDNRLRGKVKSVRSISVKAHRGGILIVSAAIEAWPKWAGTALDRAASGSWRAH